MRRFLPVLLLALTACAPFGRRAAPPTLVFLTDFGTQDDSVALCKGVMLGVEPDLRIIDLTHQAPVYDIRAGARLIEGAAPHYRSGTVFVAVVDPGVGTERKALAVRTKAGRTYVGPDNGLFWPIVRKEGLEKAVSLENKKYMLSAISGTFHGRDIFSPVGAHLAKGAPLEDMGPALDKIVELPARDAALREGVLEGEVDFIERPYGNVITNIPDALVKLADIAIGDRVQVRIGSKTFDLPFLKTFGDAPEGSDLALYSSRGRMSFSVNMGDFAKKHDVAAGQTVSIRKK